LVGPLRTNCYLLWVPGSPEAAVVDPGGDAAGIAAALRREGLGLGTVLLTHGHADHLAGLGELLACFGGAEVVVGQEDAPLVGAVAADPSAREGGDAPSHRARLRRAADGERLKAGGTVLDVLSTPGHTPGGLCYHLASGAPPVLFSGDTLFLGSVGRTDLPGGSWPLLAASLRKLARLSPETLVLPGHGPQSSLAREMDGNPFLQQALQG
jgi:glyoxylase-like metal-dependent hydrolase (beta-lactamase superfamily II)